MSVRLSRSYARRAVVQVLYQLLVNDQEIAQENLDFVTSENSDKMDTRYFKTLVEGISQKIDILNTELAFAADRSIDSIDPVEISILRLAVYEFIHRSEIPYRVVLNEAVELAKSLGGEQGYKYVNAVLDRIGLKFRSDEYKAANSISSKK